MLNIKKLGTLFVAATLLFAITSCSNSGSKNKSAEVEKKKLTFYIQTGPKVLPLHTAKIALEANGFEVELTNLEPGLIYGELSKDDSKGDVFMDAWLPNTHKDYWADYGDKLVKLGESFSNGTTGLVVPSYVTINSIEELNANKDKFDGEIIGIGSGAGIHASTEKVIEEYGLDFEQITSSGPAMVASLEKAIKNNEWIVITGWKPHFKWAKNDLKYLEDPKGIYPKDVCAIISRRGFAEEMPKAGTFFKNFNLEEPQLYDLMGKISDSGEEAGAQQFYDANKAMIDARFN